MPFDLKRLETVRVGDTLTVFAGWIPWEEKVTKVTAKLIYTVNDYRYRKADGVRIGGSLNKTQVVDVRSG